MEDRFRQHLAVVGMTLEGFSTLEDADQARVREVLSNALHRVLFAQLMAEPRFSLPLFLQQPEALQDSLIRHANQVTLLIKHVMPFEKLISMEEPLRSELIEWGREVKRLVHDYRVPLSDLLALNEEQRSELIVNANYFSKILSEPENQRTVEQLLNIGTLGLTEPQALERVNTAVAAFSGQSRVLLQNLRDHLPAEMIVSILEYARNSLFIGPNQARRIIENTPFEEPEASPPASPRSPVPKK